MGPMLIGMATGAIFGTVLVLTGAGAALVLAGYLAGGMLGLLSGAIWLVVKPASAVQDVDHDFAGQLAGA